MFPSKNFKFLTLLIYFELIYVCEIRVQLHFFFSRLTSFSSTICFKIIFFPPRMLASLLNQLTIETFINFCTYSYILMTVPHSWDYCCFLTSLEMERGNPLFFFFNIVLSLLGSLSFHINCRICCQFIQRSHLQF